MKVIIEKVRYEVRVTVYDFRSVKETKYFPCMAEAIQYCISNKYPI